MRKILLLLSLALFCCQPMYSRGEDLKVIAVVEKQKPTTKTNRAPAKSQVECYYYPSISNIELSFLSDHGSVTVFLENQITGEDWDYFGNSASGRMVIPVEPDTAYRMDITTENGHNYYAVFFTDNDSDE